MKFLNCCTADIASYNDCRVIFLSNNMINHVLVCTYVIYYSLLESEICCNSFIVYTYKLIRKVVQKPVY